LGRRLDNLHTTGYPDSYEYQSGLKKCLTIPAFQGAIMFTQARKTVYNTLSAFVIGLSLISYADANCLPIGGVGMPNFVPQKDGTTTIVAALTGSAVTAAGAITDERKTAGGLEMEMEHYCMTDKGGFMHTRDRAVLSSVKGKDERYMIEITYQIQPESTSGELHGFKGQFKSFGLVDLAKLKGLIRYSGEICQ
jgi:hypothetical protein